MLNFSLWCFSKKLDWSKYVSLHIQTNRVVRPYSYDLKRLSFLILKGIDTVGRFSTICYEGGNFSDLPVCYPADQVPSEKEYTLKEKNLLPFGSKFFPFRVYPFSEERQAILTEFAPLKV